MRVLLAVTSAAAAAALAMIVGYVPNDRVQGVVQRIIYVGYMMLRAYTPDPERAARLSAVLGIVGFIDIPIIHFSVQWWRTLHPVPVIARSDPQLPVEMILTLLVSLVAMTLLFATLLVYRTRL